MYSFLLLKKNLYKSNIKQFEDFYITGKHPIIINGTEIEAENIPKAIHVHLDPTLVYTICVEKREPLLINGLHILSWELDEWIKKSKEHNVIWYDNGHPHLIHNL